MPLALAGPVAGPWRIGSLIARVGFALSIAVGFADAVRRGRRRGAADLFVRGRYRNAPLRREMRTRPITFGTGGTALEARNYAEGEAR